MSSQGIIGAVDERALRAAVEELLDIEDFFGVLELARRHPAVIGESPWLRARAILARSETGEWEVALDLIQSARQRWPNSASVLAAESYLMLEQGKPGVAKERIALAYAFDPEDPLAIEMAANLEFVAGDVSVAAANLERLALRHDRARHWSLWAAFLGMVDLAAGNRVRAEMADRFPESYAVHSRRAWDALEDRDPATALESARAAHAMSPRSIAAARAVMLAEFGVGNRREAEWLAQANIEANPRDKVSLSQLRLFAVIRKDEGMIRECEARLEKIDPDSAAWREMQKAMRLANVRGPLVAINALRPYQSHRSNAVVKFAADALIPLLWQTGKYVEALDALEKRRRISVRGPDIVRQSIEIYSYFEKWDAALSVCDAELAVEPENQELRQQRNRIERRAKA